MYAFYVSTLSGPISYQSRMSVTLEKLDHSDMPSRID